MRNILITGGSGFIGTHLCRSLQKDGQKNGAMVRVLDLKIPKEPVHGVEYIQGDIRNENQLSAALKDIDAVFHFAAAVSVPYCQQYPVESYEVNLIGTLKVVQAIKQESEKSKRKIRLIFSSSSVVYAESGKENSPIEEQQAQFYALSHYGAQKAGSEKIIKLFCKEHQIPAVIFRFFNVYGEGQDSSSPYSGVITLFADAIKNHKPLLLNGGGQQTRDFISVHDIVSACHAALGISDQHCVAEPLNLGSGHAIKVKDLASLIGELAQVTPNIQIAPPRAGDIQHSLANIKKAKEVLGWSPSVSIREGLPELLKV